MESVDDAVAAFCLLLRAELGSERVSPARAETYEQAEARYFRLARELLQAACPGRAACTDRRCRRGGCCRHLADLDAQRRGRLGPRPTRRTPGADALRHAIWVYMNSPAAETGVLPCRSRTGP
jgi:hypothetical protein